MHTANTYNGLEALDGVEVFEEVRVGDLARSPLALIFGVVDHWSIPLALVGRVSLEGATSRMSDGITLTSRLHVPLPLATSGSLITLGVADSRGNPITVLFVIPFLRLLSI